MDEHKRAAEDAFGSELDEAMLNKLAEISRWAANAPTYHEDHLGVTKWGSHSKGRKPARDWRKKRKAKKLMAKASKRRNR